MPVEAVHTQRIVPNGLMELMFYLGERPTSMDASKNLTENTIVSGQQKGFYDIAVSGKLSLFSISFLPYGAKMFFGIPSNDFFDCNIPLRYLLKDGVERLEDNLFEADTFEAKICIVEAFLVALLKRNAKEYELGRIVKSISLINQSKGLIGIDELSSSACLSRKQFERAFSDYIGTSPKQFLRTIRFQYSLYEKQRNKNIDLTELAYSCGYYDQSHMINDYKLLSGKTPTQYFSECEPYSDYFL